MRDNRYAEIHRIEDNLWAIDEIHRTTIYLYAGRERALLLDTGLGLLDLPAIARESCPGRELVVVNTHAHPDHNGGNCQFDTVCVGRMDEPDSVRPMDAARRAYVADSFLIHNGAGYEIDPAGWEPGPSQRVLPLRDGDVIDLGGVTLEVLETPGHTRGSVCLLDRANGNLFTGDMVLTWQVWGQLETSTTLLEYSRSLDRLARLEPVVKRLLPAHGRADNPFGWPIWYVSPRALSVYAEGTRRIVEGKAAGTPFHDGPEGLVVYFEIGGMVYNPRRVGVRPAAGEHRGG